MENYIWTISALDCIVSKDNLQNVVKTVHWRYRLTDENNVSVEIFGAQPVGEPNPDEFQPYEDLTEEIVVGWLESTMDIDAKQQTLQDKLEVKLHPTVVTLPLPTSGSEATIEGNLI